MLADWAAECSPESPVLVVPWSDPDSAAEFVDLRADPYVLYRIPEAEEHQPLMQALRALNAPRSPVFSAKCDAYALGEEEREQLRIELDLSAAESLCGFATYIDLIWRDRSIFTSFHQQEQILRRLIRHAAALDHPAAELACILRPAIVDLDGPREGFAMTIYVKALGRDLHEAWDGWSAALESVVSLVRGRDLTR